MKKNNRSGWLSTNRDNILVTLIASVFAAMILAGISAGVSAAREGLIVDFLGGVAKSNLKTLPPFPADAIVAFDRPGGCPDGWTQIEEAQGRIIVGVGTLSGDENEERPEYRYRHDGGEHEVALTDKHLPRHQHGYEDVFYTEKKDERDTFLPPSIRSVEIPGNWGSHGGWDDDNDGWVRPDTMTQFSGSEGPAPFTNMQPYIVFYYCKLE